jgi:hypothetical protein
MPRSIGETVFDPTAPELFPREVFGGFAERAGTTVEETVAGSL